MSNKEGSLFVISAPAGTGKTTLVEKLCAEVDGLLRCITCTTRAPRPGEVNGVDYFFLKEDQFESMVRDDAFYEYVHLFDHSYGTPRTWVENQLENGVDVILVIDTEGAMKIASTGQPVLIFVSPPSITALQERLASRNTESSEAQKARLARAVEEMAMKDRYHYEVINDKFDEAYEQLKKIIFQKRNEVRS